MTFELRVLETDGEIEQALRLRAEVWRDEKVDLPVDARGCHLDPDDASAAHLGVLMGGRLVAASRISLLPSIDSLPFAEQLSLEPCQHRGVVCSLGRLVVATECRGRGLGRSLIEHMVARARDLGASWSVVTSSVRSVEDVLSSLLFVQVGVVRIRWGDGLRATKFFIADAAEAARVARARVATTPSRAEVFSERS